MASTEAAAAATMASTPPATHTHADNDAPSSSVDPSKSSKDDERASSPMAARIQHWRAQSDGTQPPHGGSPLRLTDYTKRRPSNDSIGKDESSSSSGSSSSSSNNNNSATSAIATSNAQSHELFRSPLSPLQSTSRSKRRSKSSNDNGNSGSGDKRNVDSGEKEEEGKGGEEDGHDQSTSHIGNESDLRGTFDHSLRGTDLTFNSDSVRRHLKQYHRFPSYCFLFSHVIGMPPNFFYQCVYAWLCVFCCCYCTLIRVCLFFSQEWVDAISFDALSLASLPHSPPPLITRSSSGSQSPADAGAGPQCPPVEATAQSSSRSSPDSTESTGAVLPVEAAARSKKEKVEVRNATEEPERPPSSSSSRSSRRPRSAVSSWNFSGKVVGNDEHGNSSNGQNVGFGSSSTSTKNSGSNSSSSSSGAGVSSSSNGGRTSSVGRKTVTFESYPEETPQQQQLTLEAAAQGGSADAQYAMGTNCADGESAILYWSSHA